MSNEIRRGGVPSPGNPLVPVPGDLLVASVAPEAGYKNLHFDEAVVLVLEADDDGAIGVILNRPLPEVDFPEQLPGWAELMTAPMQLFYGGPVSTRGAVCLAHLAEGEEPPLGYGPLYDHIGFLELDTPLSLVVDHYEAMRVFAGYARWESGELEAEIEDGLWHLSSARPTDVFAGEPRGLWRSVLRRSSGQVSFFSSWTSQAAYN